MLKSECLSYIKMLFYIPIRKRWDMSIKKKKKAMEQSSHWEINTSAQYTDKNVSVIPDNQSVEY